MSLASGEIMKDFQKLLAFICGAALCFSVGINYGITVTESKSEPDNKTLKNAGQRQLWSVIIVELFIFSVAIAVVGYDR
jgi:hypothetical protein